MKNRRNLFQRVISFVLAFIISLTSFVYNSNSFNNVYALSAADAEHQIYTYLTNSMGYNNAVACGILANIECECNFNITLVESNGVGYGIIQWSGDRKTELKSWCSSHGYNYATLNGQLEFMAHEINDKSYYKKTRDAINGATNTPQGAEDVANAFCMNFEAPYYKDRIHGKYNASGTYISSGYGGYDYFPMYSPKYRISKCISERIGKTECEYRGWLASTKYWSKYGGEPEKIWTPINADCRLTVRESLPMRSSYSATSSKLADMPAGSIVHVIENGVHNGGYIWAHITWNGIEGYCNQAYLEKCDIADPPSVGFDVGTSFRDTVIKWNNCNNAAYYEVKVDGVSNGTTTSTSYSIRLSAGNHTAEVISYSSNNSASSSGVKGFTVNKTYPDKTNVTVSPGNSKSSTYVSWNQCNYADSYKMVIYSSSGTAVASQNNGDLNFSTKLSAGSYYVIVTTHNNTDNTDTASERKNFTVEAAVPATPGLNVLSGNNYTDTSFSWNECQYADNYRLEVTNKDNGTKVLNKTITGTSYSQIFSTAGNYTAIVYAVNAQDNVSTPSKSFDFYVESADCTEFDLSVAGRSDSVIVLDWTVSEHATQYDVYRYDGGKYVLIGTTEETTFTDAGLYTDTNYRYYVKASNQWTEMDSNEVETETIILTVNGSGSESDPYIISSVDDLASIRDLVNDSTTTKVFGNACYQLTTDLDLSRVSWSSIGTESCPFNGMFNGNYYTISGISTSIFGYCDNAVIENIVAYGNISSTASNVGGIVGRIGSGRIENCAFYGNVSGADNVGGIIGNMANGGSLIRCYQIGTVSGRNAVGGIVGQTTNNTAISFCYHAGGSVTGTGKIGGIAGQQTGTANYTDCYYLNTNCSYGVSNGTNAGTVAVNATVLKNLTDTLGIPFTVNPDSSVNSGYPVFSWEISTYEFKGDGTSSSPYQIETAEDLQYLSAFVNDTYMNTKYGKAYYIQTADIDMNGVAWIPIGTEDNPFSGSYNGGYRSITGLSNDSSVEYGGLFGYCGDVSVKNFIVNGSISANGSSGGIIGIAHENCTLDEVAFIGSVNGTDAGGLVGRLDGKANIIQCYHNGVVKGTNAGGLVGTAENTNKITTETFFIRNSYHTNGAVSGTSIGGIIGAGSGHELENCFYLKGSTSSTKNGIAANETVMKSLSETIEVPFTDNDNASLNNGYPVFTWQISRYEFDGKGTKDDPYLIWQKEDLIALQEYVNNPAYHDSYANAYYQQIGDIDLGDIQWEAIGMSEELAFNGVYDGGYYTVFGLNASGETYSGLFGQVGATSNGRNAGIYNIIIEYGTSSSSTGVVGGTAAVLMNGATADSCAVIGDLYGDSGVGGIVGIVRKSGTITNSYHNGNVNGNSRVGGILGYAESGTARIENCYHTVGTVEGVEHLGAIAGYVDGSVKIDNCYYLAGTCNGAVDGRSNTGVTITNETVLKSMAPMLGEAYIDNVYSVYFNDGYPIFAEAVLIATHGKLLGDVNADGEFNVSDIVLLQKLLLAVPNTELANWNAADFCEDNRLDVFDLCLMKRALIEQNN